MTVSILGCGWYGLALAKSLVSKGFKVKGSTTSPSKMEALAADGVTPFLIDLSAGGAINQADFFSCDVLIIAIPPKSRTGEGAGYLPKLQCVIHVINQHPIKKVIYISSTGIYANLNKEVNEQTDPQPDTDAAKILYAAEELFRRQTKFKITIIRFAGLIGPGREPGRFFSGKKNIPNGLAPVNLIHLDDCIGITHAVIDADAFGYTLNACNPHHPGKSAFYSQAAANTGLEPPDFLPELKKWKIISSVNNDKLLKYKYKVADLLKI